MQRILELRNQPLSIDDLLELHAILGEGALEVEDAATGLVKRRFFKERRVGKGKRFQPTAAFVKKLKGA